MTDCRREFPASWFARAKLCAEHHDAAPQLLRRQRLAVARRRGGATAGSVRRIRAAGSSGTAAITWAAGPPTMRGRSAAGGRSRGTSPRSGRTASRAISSAAAGSDRRVLHWAYDSRKIVTPDAWRCATRRPFASASPRACSGEAVRFDGGHKRDAFPDRARSAGSWNGCRSVRKWNAASARRGNRCGWCASRTACGC